MTDVFASVGGSSGAEQASFTVQMEESGLLAKIEPTVRRQFAGVSGLALTFGSSMTGGGSAVTSRPIQLNVNTIGSLDELNQASVDVMNAIRDVPGLVDLDRSALPGKPEMHIAVDRQTAVRSGLSTAVVGSTVRTLFNGQTVSRYRESGREADIVMRLR